ncbi:MAG: periplasmic heavy metal sensor [Bacteroidales bacterium]|nr:periplasmic heavy metal sensor [Bacteroidales bacterium]
MNKNVIIWILSILVTILLTAIITFFLIRPDWDFWYRKQCCTHSPFKKNMLYEKLQLTSEQISTFEKLRSIHWQEVEILHDSLYHYRLILLDELEKKQPDSSTVHRLVQKINLFEYKLQFAFINHALQVKKILTPEQQKIFFDHFRNRWALKPGKGCGLHYHGRKF